MQFLKVVSEGFFGQKLGGSFYRVQFSQRGASSYWCPWGVVFLWKIRVGSGSGVRTSKGTDKLIRKLCRNYPLANYPLVSPRFLSSKSSAELQQTFAENCTIVKGA